MTRPPTVTRADRERSVRHLYGYPDDAPLSDWLQRWVDTEAPHRHLDQRAPVLAADLATHREATEAAIVALVAEIGGPSLIDYLKRGLPAPDAAGEPTGFWDLDRKAARVLQALIERGEHRR